MRKAAPGKVRPSAMLVGLVSARYCLKVEKLELKETVTRFAKVTVSFLLSDYFEFSLSGL
jgi:hypothetical protein